jgi:hypothetical protein
MPLELQEIAISQLTMEALPELFAPGGGSGPLGGLGSEAPFGAIFEAARAAGTAADVDAPSLPWPRETGQHFWTSYFEGRSFGAITPRNAWRNLVPIRLRQPKLTLAGFPGCRIWAEIYAYPHGLAVILGFRLSGSWSTTVAGDLFAALRNGDVSWTDGAERTARLPDIPGYLLERGRTVLLGPELQAGTRSQPFVVTTVVRASGIDPQTVVDNGGEIHRLANGLASFDPSWRTVALPDLAPRRLPGLVAPAGHLVYARGRGRAVWFPSHFTGASGSTHALGCYHRNLTMTSLTVEALASLVAATVTQLADGRTLEDLPYHQADLSKRAAVLLSQLYLGKKTYSTMSAKRQIVDSGYGDDLTALREVLKLAPAALE